MEITARKRQLWSASSKSMFAGSGKSLELMNKGRGLNFSCLKHGTIIYQTGIFECFGKTVV